MRNRKRPALDSARRERGGNRRQFVERAGEHGFAGGVERREGDLRPARDQATRRGLVGENREHPAARRQSTHQPSARRDEPQPVFEREHACHARGDELTDAVSGHGRRPHAARAQKFRQRPFERKECGLGEFGLGEPRRGRTVGRGVQDTQQRNRQQRVEHGRAAVERATEHRLVFIETAAHAGKLRALSREQKRHRRHRGIFDRRRRAKLGGELNGGAPDHREPVRESGARGIDRRAHIGERRVGMRVEPRGHIARERHKRS